MKTGIIFCLLWAMSLSAASCTATPLACKVSASSVTGGRVAISKSDPTADGQMHVPLGIEWYLPGSTDSLEMGVGYSEGRLDHLGDASGAYVSLAVSGPQTNYQVRVSTDTGENWSFGPSDVLGVYVPNREIVPFAMNDIRGRDILKAVNGGKRIKIEVLSGDRVENLVVFDASNIAARDQILTQAAKKITDRDPSVCKPIGSLPNSYPAGSPQK